MSTPIKPVPNVPNPAIQPFFPIDYNPIRKTLVNVVQQVTGLQCIVEERKGQTTVKTPRPTLPYCSFKIMGPAGKIGTDGFLQNTGTSQNPNSIWTFGGVRKMMVSFKAYGQIPEEAYNYLSLLEAAFDTFPVQSMLRANNFSFWQSLGVIDISAVLTAGYEGRASMDASFGVPSRLNVNLGEIDTAVVNGNIAFGSKSAAVNFNVSGAPTL